MHICIFYIHNIIKFEYIGYLHGCCVGISRDYSNSGLSITFSTFERDKKGRRDRRPKKQRNYDCGLEVILHLISPVTIIYKRFNILLPMVSQQ